MNSALNSEAVAKHVRFVCGLDEELSGAFLSMLYGEPVTALEHVALVAGGDIPVPPAERMAQAAAEVAGFAGYRYEPSIITRSGGVVLEPAALEGRNLQGDRRWRAGACPRGYGS